MYKNNQTYLANVRCLTNQIQGQTTDFKPDRQSPFSCSQKRNSIKVHQQAMSYSMTKFRFSKILPQAKMSSSNSNVQVSLTGACTYHYKKREFTIGKKRVSRFDTNLLSLDSSWIVTTTVAKNSGIFVTLRKNL